VNTFHLVTYAQEIIAGPGSIDQLADAVERFGWQRLMVCASPSMRRAGYLDTLMRTPGNRLVASYEHVQSHVQDCQLAEALTFAEERQIDAVIGLGGGSPIGMAKAVSFTLEERRRGRPAKATYPTEQPLVPVIAIPTTYAGSEMTSVYGVTHTGDTPRKITVRDPKITPKLVIYDPNLTLDLPPQMTASSGINALAHCIEALYSITRNPLATAAAQSGIEHIWRALPVCTTNGANQEARSEMLIGAHLAGLALSMTTMGLHHGLCHVLGGSANVPHGIANSIILPHAMQFNLDATVPQLTLVARAMGLCSDDHDDQAAAGAAVEGVFKFIGALGLPQRLRDAGILESDLPRLAELALQSRAVQDNPKPITDIAQIESVLRAAW
jgi:alcohol dehydrogenase class IV